MTVKPCNILLVGAHRLG